MNDPIPYALDGPFNTREQAEACFAGFRAAALSGTAGPPGEQLVYEPGQLEHETLLDTADVLGADLGDYDRQVLGRVAGLLDPVDIRVVNSIFLRVAHDVPDAGVAAG